MKSVEKKIAFYGALVSVIRDREGFITSSAEALVKLYEEIKSDVFIEDVTLEFLAEAYDEYHDNNRDLDIMEGLTEAAFKDLARHMRNPEVRRVFNDFSDMSGTNVTTDLFVQMGKVRLLDNSNETGPAVVTLVVNSYEGLQELLKKNGEVEVVHLV